jgi:uncharacterized membrane protein YphA (DoxX/SURF4 family)
MSKLSVFSRVSLFVIYFWFGFLKVIGWSPASALVNDLSHQTYLDLFISPEYFVIVFGVGECILGIMFLIPRLTRLSKWLFTLHMVTTFMPLFLVPKDVWVSWFAPTLEGQYIIKNLALIATVLHLKTPERSSQNSI